MNIKYILKLHKDWLDGVKGGKRANLRNVDLRCADLSYANLRNADISRTSLPHYNIVPEIGGFYAWKKTTMGVIKIYIPSGAKRTSSLIGRKCRASPVKVISGEPGASLRDKTVHYTVGKTVYADKFNDDIRVECTHGIHFFMTKQEAEEW